MLFDQQLRDDLDNDPVRWRQYWPAPAVILVVAFAIASMRLVVLEDQQIISAPLILDGRVEILCDAASTSEYKPLALERQSKVRFGVVVEIKVTRQAPAEGAQETCDSVVGIETP